MLSHRLAVLILLVVTLTTPTTPRSAIAATDSRPPSGSKKATITTVVDGDTIKVLLNDKPYTVRLIGVDTPETKDPNSPVECYGAEASAYTAKTLTTGREVYLEKDVSNRDRFDRLLRYVWIVGKGDGKARLFNEQLVRAGYAVVSTYPPDVKYVERFTAAERSARDKGAGLWNACGGADTPLEPTPAPEPTSEPAPPPVEQPAVSENCDPSYPTVCISPSPPDLDCGDIPYRRFQVVGADPHRFDGDHDGIGCESG